MASTWTYGLSRPAPHSPRRPDMENATWHRTGFPWSWSPVIKNTRVAADIACQIEVEWTPAGGHTYEVRVWTIDNRMVSAPADWVAPILADIRETEPEQLADAERNAEVDYVRDHPGAWAHASVYAAE